MKPILATLSICLFIQGFAEDQSRDQNTLQPYRIVVSESRHQLTSDTSVQRRSTFKEPFDRAIKKDGRELRQVADGSALGFFITFALLLLLYIPLKLIFPGFMSFWIYLLGMCLLLFIGLIFGGSMG